MAALRDAFSAEHALQCGYCTPGMLVMARDVVQRLPGADGDRIRKEMSGNLCRCTGYRGIIDAIHGVAAKQDGTAPVDAPTVAAKPSAPVVAAPAAPAAPVASVARPMDESGMTRIEDSFTVSHPREAVWAFFAETERVARCMPGAQVTAVDGGHIDGEIRIKLGPMKAAFAGEGDVTRDDATYSGTIAGRGLDRGSSSRATGRVTYALAETEDGRATRVDIAVAYALTGPLAQFSRGGIARDLAARLTTAFAENLEQALTTGEAPAAGDDDGGLDALSLVLAMVRGWFARLFGRQSG
jgi:carbon-monoxide dehydrogenase small subunit